MSAGSTVAVTAFLAAHMLIGTAQTAHADPWAASYEGTDATALEEVVVTARKRAESQLDVPMSLSILGGEEIEKSGILDLQDLGREVPGLTVVSFAPGQNQITLRGVSGNNTVGLYLDDTPLALFNAQVEPNNWFMDPGMFDLARIEVLKGPQGTLYGASSLGGTVRYITNPPDLTASHATLKVTGSYSENGGPNGELDALVNQPLIRDYVAVRASWFIRANDGFIDRYPTAPNNYLAILPGPVEHGVNTENDNGGRIAIMARPTGSFSVTLSSAYQNMRLGAPSTFDEPPGDLNNPIQSRVVSEASTDRTWLHSLTLDWTIKAVHLTSSTSYFDREYYTGEDDTKALAYSFPLPGGLAPPSRVYSDISNRNLVEEMRGSGSVGSVHALIGLFYSHARYTGDIGWPSVAAYESTFDNVIPFYGVNLSYDVQKAAFGEINIDITPKLQATLGARKFHDSQTLNLTIQGVYAGSATPIQTYGTATASGVTPKYGLSYHVTDSALVYADVEKGFRAGGPGFPVPANCIDDYRALGFPDAQIGTPTTYKPDTIWNYELGAKTEWLDKRLAVNAFAYYIRWRSIQQTIILACSDTFTGNFGAAKSEGVEFDLHYYPVAGLRFDVSGAFNEAYLTETVPGAQGVTGQTLEYAPRWTGSLTAEYDRSIGSESSGFVRASVNTSTHQYTSFQSSSPYYNMAGYSLSNLRLGVKRGRWQSSLFIENLCNKRAIIDLYNAYGSNVPTTQQLGLNRPRTIGVDFRIEQ